ncbi:MAG: zinc ribbon domain-containing protein [Capsulimonadales bacterium]|nr:zinc ribbon domain-containing protein [Capsulimonadales bacterium]
MIETRERFCPHCGRANPVTMPRCMNCGQRVGGSLLLTEAEPTTVRSEEIPWWQTSAQSPIPPPPQVREQIARQEAAQREKARVVEEQRRFQERLEDERQRSAERLATIRERRRERVERVEGKRSQTEPAVAPAVGTTVAHCHKCHAPLGQAGHTFSFCLHCGADVQPRGRTTAAVPTKPTATVFEEQTRVRPVVRHSTRTTETVGVTARATETQRTDLNPVIPAVLSAVCPGIGQFINGQPTKGVLLLLALFIAMAVFNVPAIFLIIGRGLAAADAYTIARRRRDGWPVREDEWDFGG